MVRRGWKMSQQSEAICEKQFHYTSNNRQASKRQLPLFTLLNML